LTDTSQNEPDAGLLTRLKRGDIAAQAAIYDLFAERLYRLSLRLMGNHADAEDTSQEIFIRIFKHADKFNGRSRFSTWIYTIAMHHCLTRISQRKRRTDMEHVAADRARRDGRRVDHPALERLVVMEEIEVVDEMLESLSPPYRACIVLREIEGLSYARISEILGIPLGTVMSRLARARRILREMLREKSGESAEKSRNSSRLPAVQQTEKQPDEDLR